MYVIVFFSQARPLKMVIQAGIPMVLSLVVFWFQISFEEDPWNNNKPIETLLNLDGFFYKENFQNFYIYQGYYHINFAFRYEIDLSGENECKEILKELDNLNNTEKIQNMLYPKRKKRSIGEDSKDNLISKAKFWRVEDFIKSNITICFSNENELIFCKISDQEPKVTDGKIPYLDRTKRLVIDAISMGMSTAALSLKAANTVRIKQIEKNSDLLINALKVLNEREDSVSKSLELVQTNDKILFTKTKLLSKGLETMSKELCNFEVNTIKNFKAITKLLLSHLFNEEISAIKRSMYFGKLDPDCMDKDDFDKLNNYLRNFEAWKPYRNEPELMYYLGKITNFFYDFPSITFTLAIPILVKDEKNLVSILYPIPVFVNLERYFKLALPHLAIEIKNDRFFNGIYEIPDECSKIIPMHVICPANIIPFKKICSENRKCDMQFGILNNTEYFEEHDNIVFFFSRLDVEVNFAGGMLSESPKCYLRGKLISEKMIKEGKSYPYICPKGDLKEIYCTKPYRQIYENIIFEKISHYTTIEIIVESNDKTSKELVKFLQQEENLDKYFFTNQDELSKEIIKQKALGKDFFSLMGQISENDNKLLFWIIAIVTIISMILIMLILCYCGFKKWRNGLKQAQLINEHDGIQLQQLRHLG